MNVDYQILAILMCEGIWCIQLGSQLLMVSATSFQHRAGELRSPLSFAGAPAGNLIKRNRPMAGFATGSPMISPGHSWVKRPLYLIGSSLPFNIQSNQVSWYLYYSNKHLPGVIPWSTDRCSLHGQHYNWTISTDKAPCLALNVCNCERQFQS